MHLNQEKLYTQEKFTPYYLLLDDYRFPFLIWWVNLPEPTSHKWVIARHYYDFIHIIENNGIPEFIAFDHDLDRHPFPVYSDERPGKNGLDCANWLIDYCKKHNLKFPNCAVHSTNPTDGPKIVESITNYINKA
jgi:hypothetical protein